MDNPISVKIHYSGNVKHKINEVRGRPIRKGEREALKMEFSSGIKPLKKYLNIIAKKLMTYCLVEIVMVWEKILKNFVR